MAGRAWRAACLGASVVLLALSFAGGLLPGDVALRNAILSGATPGLTEAADWVNHGGSWPVLLPATLLLLALSRQARQRWWLWCGILIAAPIAQDLLKHVVARSRPSGPRLGFPSGHATAAATYAVILIYMVSRARIGPAARAAVLTAGVAGGLLVGLARIVLNAHWPSDVLGGWALGAACAAAGAWWEAARGPAGRAEAETSPLDARTPGHAVGRPPATPPSQDGQPVQPKARAAR